MVVRKKGKKRVYESCGSGVKVVLCEENGGKV